MARITAGIACSHVPAIGVAMDTGITGQPYWQPVFKGFEFSRDWMKKNKPDVIFLVYNDHCTAFDGITFQDLAAKMTGMSREDYRDMMLHGGRSIEGNRFKSEWEEKGKE